MSKPPAELAPPIDGTCDARFAAVRQAFEQNLRREDEIGAAVCIHAEGRKVVDLWGGFADLASRTPWQRDTLVNSYSVGKGLLAVLVLAIAEHGELDPDARVADAWPAFAAHGKEEIRFATLASHRAGLPAVRAPLPEGAMFDWDRMCRSLAAQEPWWPPGTRHGYHSATFGYLVGECVRRATGRPLAEAMKRYVTGPLGADYAWGIAARDAKRVARLHSPAAENRLTTPEQRALAFPPTGDPEHDLMVWHSYLNPSGLSGAGLINTLAWQQAVVPSANGHGTARAVASIYDGLIAPAARAPRLASREWVERGRQVLADGPDLILKRHSRFGLGFQLTHESRPLGRGPRAFGHYGYGGSLGFADPENGIAFGYLRNKPGDRWQTPCTQALVDALYDTLGVSR